VTAFGDARRFLQTLEEAKHLTFLADRMPAGHEKHGRYRHKRPEPSIVDVDADACLGHQSAIAMTKAAS
jgi:hypothetical protein